MTQATATTARDVVTADLNFARQTTEIPKVLYEYDGAAPRYNKAYQSIATPIANGRATGEPAKLDREGFELVSHKSAVLDFDNNEAVEEIYYQEVRDIVKAATGADHVVIFDHTLRRENAVTGRTPARHVHVDYTEESAPRRAFQVLSEEDQARFAGKRFVQVNAWRSINGTVERSPLAFMDARTLKSEDLVKTEISYRDKSRVGEIYGVRHRDDQRWFTFPAMTQDEVALIKGYDTRKDGPARFTPHSAFEDPNSAANARPRGSIEVRTFAFFNN